MAVAERLPVDVGRPAGRSARNALLVAGGIALLAATLRLADAGGIPQIQNFLLVFSSLLIEALPFILLGAVVSAAIEVFVPARAFARVGRLPAPLQMPLAGLGGFAFPVCECGSVPVARRLTAKGLSPQAALTFMLAAPVLNPIVLVATAVAYRGREAMWVMVGGRAALALAVALVAGWVLGGRGRSELLRTPADEPHADCADVDCAHHEDEPRWKAFTAHLAGDFLMLGKYLVIGAAAAGLLQTFIPQSFIGAVADTPVLSIVALMGLAAALSLCSQSDAFVAASFVQFGPASQLAFLVFGPMVDAKLGFLYAGTFSKGFVRTLVVVVAAVTLAGTLWLEVAVG
jgi:uncharacterized membrane protein YraQ (UPF0718 family)